MGIYQIPGESPPYNSDEDEDYDPGVDGGNDWKGEVRVGDEYQAYVPPTTLTDSLSAATAATNSPLCPLLPAIGICTSGSAHIFSSSSSVASESYAASASGIPTIRESTKPLSGPTPISLSVSIPSFLPTGGHPSTLTSLPPSPTTDSIDSRLAELAALLWKPGCLPESSIVHYQRCYAKTAAGAVGLAGHHQAPETLGYGLLSSCGVFPTDRTVDDEEV
ncbi:unnamed protein product [Protopolystoma xenopodis]|uniref:ELM2 domain-containing protein n=1 Tax=Protopolystoma xenopodis TaxID=117903 RepID=A0A3S5AL20_9PLAT|nr:unnamed protein product [Protopolystoma xenopodis]